MFYIARYHERPEVDITKDLKWNQHVNKITASANRSLGFLRRNISFCSRKTKAIAFITFVRPYLEYSSAVWDSYKDEQITQIEAAQRRGAIFVYSDYSYESRPRLKPSNAKEPDLSSVIQLREQPICHDRLYKVGLTRTQKKGTPPDRPPQRTTWSHSTRNSNSANFIKITTNKDCLKYSFFPRTVTDWNSLPISITSITDQRPFKQQLHKHLRN